MAIPIQRVLQMGSNAFRIQMETRRGVIQPFNPVPENTPIISDEIPNIQNLPHAHPLVENLPPELQLYGQLLRRETSSRCSVLQILYRYLQIFRFEERQLTAGFAPVQPQNLNHDFVTAEMCDMLGYATGEIANRIEEIYLEFVRYYQHLLQTSPQELDQYPNREAANPENRRFDEQSSE